MGPSRSVLWARTVVDQGSTDAQVATTSWVLVTWPLSSSVHPWRTTTVAVASSLSHRIWITDQTSLGCHGGPRGADRALDPCAGMDRLGRVVRELADSVGK